LAQTVPGIEILVSDNGSRDRTAAVLASYDDPRLRYFRHEQTMPATDHGNFLIEQARGEYFLGLSDDDYLEPGFVAAVRERLDSLPWLDFLYTGAWVHYGEVAVPTMGGPEIESGESMLNAFYAGRREVCWCACICRLSAMRRIGPIPSGRIFGDMFYWTQLALQSDVGCIKQPLSHYTFMTGDNLSTGVSIMRWAEETRLLSEQVITGLVERGSDRIMLSDLRTNSARFLARSTANQAAWNVIRGVSKQFLLIELWRARHYLAGDLLVWPRALTSIVLPRGATRRLVLAAAARRSKARMSWILPEVL
jgi:glycosyltransferase involved in cell wall biosynthesis